MSVAHRTAVRWLKAGALTAVVACTDQRVPTAPTLPDLPRTANAANNINHSRVKIGKLQLSENQLRLGGPAATASVDVANTGSATFSDVFYRVEIAQPAGVQLGRTDTPIHCLNEPSGSLPSGGDCQFTFTFSATNTNSLSGFLVPGLAVFRFVVMQSTPNGAIELASKTVDVNLIATPQISALTLSATHVGIGGVAATYTATLQNPANALQGIQLQAYISQGATRRAAGGTLVTCGGPPGQMAPGTCTMTVSFGASNTSDGVGTLIPADATFELAMSQTSNGVISTFDAMTASVELIRAAPTIASIAFATSTLVLGGASVDYNVALTNGGAPTSIVVIQGIIEQTQGATIVTRPAGGFSAVCGAAIGTLPTTSDGACTMLVTATANNDLPGAGTLIPGHARFVLYLFRDAGGTTTEFDVRSVDVTLVDGTPTITSISLNSTSIPIGGAVVEGTATIVNPGASLVNVVVQNWVRQGTARRAAGGSIAICGSAPVGTLPSGTCLHPTSVVTDNSASSGTGTLVPGTATLESELIIGGIIVDTKSTPITLVAAGS